MRRAALGTRVVAVVSHRGLARRWLFTRHAGSFSRFASPAALALPVAFPRCTRYMSFVCLLIFCWPFRLLDLAPGFAVRDLLGKGGLPASGV